MFEDSASAELAAGWVHNWTLNAAFREWPSLHDTFMQMDIRFGLPAAMLPIALAYVLLAFQLRSLDNLFHVDAAASLKRAVFHDLALQNEGELLTAIVRRVCLRFNEALESCDSMNAVPLIGTILGSELEASSSDYFSTSALGGTLCAFKNPWKLLADNPYLLFSIQEPAAL
jgi:hypothetical protein